MLRVKRDDLRRRGVERVPTRVAGVQRRPARARRRPRGRRGHRRVVHRLQAGLRLDRPAGLRRGRLPAGVPRRRRRRARAVLLRAVASSTPSARWCSSASAATRSTSPARSTLAQSRLAPAARPPPDGTDGDPSAVGYPPRKGGARWAWSTTWLGPGRPTSGVSGSRPTTRSPTSTRRALDADDFARLAMAAFLSAARTTASRPCSAPTRRTSTAARRSPAVRCGFWLAHGPAHQRRGRGRRRLGRRAASGSSRTSTGDVVERGYLLIHVMFRHIFSGEFEQAFELAVGGHRLRPPVRRPRPGRQRAQRPGPDAALLRPRPRGPGPARRGDGRDQRPATCHRSSPARSTAR